MPLNDLRDYIGKLRSLGELQDIALPVALDLEVSAIARRCYETGAAAPLFTLFSDHPGGFRVLGAPAGLSRQSGLRLARSALSLGMPATSGGLEIVSAIADSLALPGIDPVVLDGAPCFENALVGEAVDLNLLPLPIRPRGDGGRCLDTWGCIVARTPDGTRTDWSIGNLIPTGAPRMANLLAPHGHLETIARSWADLGQPLPFALAFGVAPAIPFICGMPLPVHVNKARRLGALLGRPIETVRCRTVALEAPASAEILIEGHLHLCQALEGPMGDFPVCRWTEGFQARFICHVTAMSYRDEAILPVIVAGEPVEENHIARGIPWAAQILHDLRGAGLAVTDVWFPLEAALHWLVVTAPRDWRRKSRVNDSNDFCHRVGKLVFAYNIVGADPAVIVINDDVNPADNDELIWAFATRHRPADDQVQREDVQFAPRLAKFGRTDCLHGADRIVYNCLPPEEWGEALPIRASFRHSYPAHIVERVLSRWEAYGFDRAGR